MGSAVTAVEDGTITIPRGAHLTEPLRIVRQADRSSGPLAPRTVIIAEPDSDAAVIEEAIGEAGADAPVSSVVELIVRPGARLRYYHIQHWSRGTEHVYRQQATVERDGHLLSLLASLGSRRTQATVETRLVGAGARSDLYGVTFGDGDQRFEFHTLQDHVVERTASDLLYKTALHDRATSRYSGLIRIAKAAQKTDAYQANRNLLLSPHARADSVPMLEILADDVHCSHGATVGPIDPEQAFYAMSRGVPAPAAERMIVEGFFEQVLQRLPPDGLQEQLHAHISRKLERG